jgi:hypothetical protein
MAYLNSYHITRGSSDDIACIRYNSTLQEYLLARITQYDNGIQALKYPSAPYPTKITNAVCLLEARATTRSSWAGTNTGGLGMYLRGSSGTNYFGYLANCNYGTTSTDYPQRVGLVFTKSQEPNVYSQTYMRQVASRPTWSTSNNVPTYSGTNQPAGMTATSYISNDRKDIYLGGSVLFKVSKNYPIDSSITPRIQLPSTITLSNATTNPLRRHSSNYCRKLFSDDSWDYWYGSTKFGITDATDTGGGVYYDLFAPCWPVIWFKDRGTSGTCVVYLSSMIIIY